MAWFGVAGIVVSMNINIRRETDNDEAAIFKLTEAAFLNAPHNDHNEQFIVDALRQAGALSWSLVAENEMPELIGHVAISPVEISDGSTGWFGLGPISVRPDSQNQGIGSQLMREAIAVMKDSQAGGCVVLGDPAYYGRFGFEAQSELVLADVPAEYFQVLLLTGQLPQGIVSYHQAFYP